jgi:hypothetical protein
MKFVMRDEMSVKINDKRIGDHVMEMMTEDHTVGMKTEDHTVGMKTEDMVTMLKGVSVKNY